MRILGLCLLLLPRLIAAQPYSVGTRDDSFFDADRGRTVACQVYHPSTEAGQDVPFADGQFPVIAVGHGFVMTVDAYVYLGEHYAAQGYIVALPTTEGGFAPDHAAFGGDLSFLAHALIDAGNDGSSAYAGHVAPAAVIMGHSMGGGAAFLGAAGDTTVKALVTLAPAETSPSAIAAAGTITAPALVFAASEDCVTPIAAHQGPMYDALASPCKAFVNISGGGHCYFGDASFTCSFGELTCGPDLAISREQQHSVVTDITDLWLRVHVREEDTAWGPLLDSLSASVRYVAATNCVATFTTAPTPPSTALNILVEADAVMVDDVAGLWVEVIGMDGRSLRRVLAHAARQRIDTHDLVPGVYVVQATGSGMRWARALHIH